MIYLYICSPKRSRGSLCHVARREGAAEGGCCTPGALCVVASCTSFASGQARSLSRFAAPPSPCKGTPLHGSPSPKKASQTPKGNPLATVSHDHATTQPGTVSHRAERTCVSAQPSSADACNVGIRCSDDVMLQHIPRKGRQGRRPLQSVCAAQPTQRLPPVSGTRSESAVGDAQIPSD